ncbi:MULTISPECIES: GNAT family N-acetyltransferase [unclassified Actinomyces]|uniref:GNAT family N-acetyltransferase n=1 Tax=unclassified Actinomyces TaxID=2609248 RepID=UPI0020175532|nr:MULTISPECIES: GNAT family N-acetyltransferase [unclassified Actinomyces]MCL3778572.1 GNAT family N-acetyltransferase [Actinomyces sp. AC-20-1]MCL3789597.1 GNAT family N-acetyltransferase [Actinomyces sp. 187325]MCL3792242.1 GNAT family N-acetyltransferase [Actinomyces sp. 186855]MCL3794528.1 GNAT family N-acetyltransferase [Actinomyces sp. 217892]
MPRPSRLLGPVSPATAGGLLDLCALDPVAGVSLAGQLRRWPAWGSGDVVALGRAASPDGGAWTTGSLLPFGLAARPALGHAGASSAQVRALAEHARRRLTRNGSVYGPVEDVEPVWSELVGLGLAGREERWTQPVLVAPHLPGGLARAALDRRPAMRWAAAVLHAATGEEAPLVLPASVAMFHAELGYDPTACGGAYARHVSWLVGARRTYVVLDDGEGRAPLPGGPRRVAFKADVGALWQAPRGGVAQLTGVWTREDLRGQGLGSVALAAVVDAVRAEHVGPGGTVSLYVNDYNTAALGLYRGLGFERAGTYATILL